jgi:hypothetical protein
VIQISSSPLGEKASPSQGCAPVRVYTDANVRGAAFEEIGLPMDSARARYLTTLPPFLTRSHLIVTPVVVFILDPLIKVRSSGLDMLACAKRIHLQPELNVNEVRLFSSVYGLAPLTL